MDILAARKKAAERGKAQQKAVPEEPSRMLVPEPVPVMDSAVIEEHEPLILPETVPAAAKATTPVESVPAEPVFMTPPASTVKEIVQEHVAGEQEIELLAFRMGGEEYTVMVDSVREVLKVFQLTRVPNTPDHILGVMSLRGNVLPVFDLCKRLGLPSPATDDKSRIIVVSPDEENVGLLVERVTGVLKIMRDAIKPTPENIVQGAEYLSGIVRKNDKLYIVLDLEKALA